MHFQRFAECSDDVFWLADLLSGKLVYVSPAFERLWGVPAGDLMADPTLWGRARLDARHLPGDDSFFAEGLADVESVQEYRIRGAGGREIWIRDRRFALRDSEGRRVGAGGIAEDVTERKQAELEREALLAREMAARADAEALALSKEEFLAVVTHELRSPLNAIRGWAHVLRRGGGLNPLQEKALDAIDRNTTAQARLVDDLLDSQRILCGNLSLDLHRTPLQALVGEALDAVVHAAEEKKISLQSGEIPALTLRVDAGRVRQALVHVLSNAVKFTPAGGAIDLRISVVASGSAGAPPGSLRIEVADNGVGLGAEQLAMVFDRFTLADGSNRRQNGGLGLGLFLARQWIELHGGALTTRSDGVGQGCTFSLELPPSAIVPTGTSGVTDENTHCPLAGKRIVVVDDDSDGREALAMVLGQANAELHAFDSSAQAFDYLSRLAPEDRPDLLISDIAMPGEDGYAFMRRVRALERDSGVPRLKAWALTAYSRMEDRQRAMAAGFDGHLSKPFDSEDLIRQLSTGGGSHTTAVHHTSQVR